MADEGEAAPLVSHFLYSKKALAHGQSLCARASTLSSASASTVVDALALEAKTKWITDGVLDQLAVWHHESSLFERLLFAHEIVIS